MRKTRFCRIKRFALLLVIGLAGMLNTQAQIYDPVTWTTEVETVSEHEYMLWIKASIKPGWHLYSQVVPEDGPVATEFSFEESGAYRLVGSVEEEKGHTVHDPVFDMEITYFSGSAAFSQKITSKGNDGFTIEGEVTYMVCDEQRCLPPETKKLSFTIPGENGAVTAVETKENDIDKERVTESADPADVSGKGEHRESQKGLFTIFLIAFLSGFAALLTPCVFPMIPMTVSFFTKQSKTRAAGIKNAVFYGISIVVIYVFLGSLVTAVFGADSLNALSTNVWFNVIFFLLLVVFAASFLGAFEIVLPHSWANKVDSQANKGGIIGILFMALALAIVSFSCTGPIVGTLLVEAASKGGLAPVIGMLGFSLALALPFMLFAMFPGWLNSLPRSGGWLNSVKVVLGFLELALAFKFLSNADLVLQLHWLEREVFIAVWIAIFGMLALYLFGKISLPHDSPLKHISVGRLGLGLLVLSFTVYLVPGLWGAPLKLISGFPPPMHYSESPYGVGYTKSSGSGASHTELPEGAHYGPHDIVAFLDYEKGMAYAGKVDKPVMIDFTGHACVNCRKMEERVWSESEILNILNNEIVLISLYVDDKRELPENEQYVSETTGKEIKTIGNKWSDFQITRYKANAQPYYVLVNHEGRNLNDPAGYTPEVDEYAAWLNEGIKNYTKNKQR
ncbi:protein-disulfide reductase DsbD family protein [Sinomicrobium kalidii]|uniref:protein-disulfide reductase DsbD family protein n=1 Tax=Sinomicrobium kalidii TaxID=2900738 RepID=UPI003F5D4EF5